MIENYWDKLSGDDEHAADYMLTYGEGPGAETRNVLSNFINSDETVLDVGCGPGWNMDHFYDYGPRVKKYKGVDYSQRFVRVANQRRKMKFTVDYALPFELQDCRDLKELNDSWDVVIIQDCLEHTNDYKGPIIKCLEIARKRVIVAFWHLIERQEDEHVNDDGDDGWGAWWARPNWEKFLDTLPCEWYTYQMIDDKGKPRDFYILEKEV